MTNTQNLYRPVKVLNCNINVITITDKYEAYLITAYDLKLCSLHTLQHSLLLKMTRIWLLLIIKNNNKHNKQSKCCDFKGVTWRLQFGSNAVKS